MTQEAPRCQVWDWLRSGGTCNLPLVPTEGPCARVDFVETTWWNGMRGDRVDRFECKKPPSHHYELRNTVPPPPGAQWSSDREYYPSHEYEAPLGCPVHSAAPDRGEE